DVAVAGGPERLDRVGADALEQQDPDVLLGIGSLLGGHGRRSGVGNPTMPEPGAFLPHCVMTFPAPDMQRRRAGKLPLKRPARDAPRAGRTAPALARCRLPTRRPTPHDRPPHRRPAAVGARPAPENRAWRPAALRPRLDP